LFFLIFPKKNNPVYSSAKKEKKIRTIFFLNIDQPASWLHRKSGHSSGVSTKVVERVKQEEAMMQGVMIVGLSPIRPVKRVDACSYNQQWTKNNLVFHVRHCQQSYCLKLLVKFFPGLNDNNGKKDDRKF